MSEDAGVLDVLAGSRPLPEGPPLHLEEPGAAQRCLGPFVTPERLARLRLVASQRTWRLTALCEDFHDPHNLSACVRTADGVGLQHLHLVTPKGVPRKLSREVSLGGERWVTLHAHTSTRRAVGALQAEGFLVVATDLGPGPEPAATLDGLPGDRPLCVAFGNEHAGISQELRELADLRLRLPMLGFADSFNVSVAFALCLHTLRQRLGPCGDLDPLTQIRLVDRWLASDLPRAPDVLALLAARRVAGGGSNG